MEEQIRANAEMLVEQLRQLSGSDFGYTEESVEWLEGYIERTKSSGAFDIEEKKNRLIGVFGSFLGECIVRCYGGTWRQHEGVWCVAFSDDNMAFPFAKVAKQIDNGLDDGIAGFFKMIPLVFTDLPGPLPPTSNKPWWKLW